MLPSPKKEFGKVFGTNIIERFNDQVKDFVLYSLYRKESLRFSTRINMVRSILKEYYYKNIVMRIEKFSNRNEEGSRFMEIS